MTLETTKGAESQYNTVHMRLCTEGISYLDSDGDNGSCGRIGDGGADEYAWSLLTSS